MPKISGLGQNLLVNAYDISGDVGSISSVDNPRTLIDVTSIKDNTMARLSGLGDTTMAFNSFFDTDDNSLHDVLTSIEAGTDLDIAWLFQPDRPGSVVFWFAGVNPTYNVARNDDGSLQCSSSFEVSNGEAGNWGYAVSKGYVGPITAKASGDTTPSSTEDWTLSQRFDTTNIGLKIVAHITPPAAKGVKLILQGYVNPAYSFGTTNNFTRVAATVADNAMTAHSYSFASGTLRIKPTDATAYDGLKKDWEVGALITIDPTSNDAVLELTGSLVFDDTNKLVKAAATVKSGTVPVLTTQDYLEISSFWRDITTITDQSTASSVTLRTKPYVVTEDIPPNDSKISGHSYDTLRWKVTHSAAAATGFKFFIAARLWDRANER